MNLAWLKRLASLFRGDKGVTAIEYGLIAALIAVVIIGSISTLGDEIETTFDLWSTAVSAAVNGAGS
ncbi:MAG: Flp family type IVb pilin, partial [Alphaproteobacteria bacterium]|nr:Flp family type IVb pilin [Alphaproteobacteria bacterium]